MRKNEESNLLARLLVHGSRLGARLWRNNCGQLQDARGRWIRYGIANPGGSDLIGYLPVTITAEHVGQTLAVFVAIEAKSASEQLRPEQRQFLKVVQAHGGLVCLARSEADAEMLFAPWVRS